MMRVGSVENLDLNRFVSAFFIDWRNIGLGNTNSDWIAFDRRR